MSSVFAKSGSVCPNASLALRSLSNRAFSSRSFRSLAAFFCCRVFFSASPTRASSSRLRSDFFLLLDFLAFIPAPTPLLTLDGPAPASSSASSAAFSFRFRAASSALAAAASFRPAPRLFAPCAQSAAVACSSFAASAASLTVLLAAFFCLAASTLAFNPLGPIGNVVLTSLLSSTIAPACGDNVGPLQYKSSTCISPMLSYLSFFVSCVPLEREHKADVLDGRKCWKCWKYCVSSQ
mmetsp:Transcript_22746/g.65553  ORF Transcript_22746/g.65553 Transcript_22746/m.65553 type:complete len:237 (+) Transcript_22746:346-1056(+)